MFCECVCVCTVYICVHLFDCRWQFCVLSVSGNSSKIFQLFARFTFHFGFSLSFSICCCCRFFVCLSFATHTNGQVHRHEWCVYVLWILFNFFSLHYSLQTDRADILLLFIVQIRKYLIVLRAHFIISARFVDTLFVVVACFALFHFAFSAFGHSLSIVVAVTRWRWFMLFTLHQSHMAKHLANTHTQPNALT